MDLISLGNILTALWITLFLMVCHYLSPLVQKITFISPRKISSFAGGVAVAYVFLHMLPELVEGNVAIGEMLKDTKVLTPLLDLGIFIVALFGFVIYYALEVIADRQMARIGKNSRAIYYLHLFMYFLYNLLITYTMPLRVQTGIWFAIIFSFSMGIHFILMDRNFDYHFKEYFNRSGRFILLFALLLGWFITAVTNPINVLFASLMIAFLSGSVLYTVFREELPSAKKPHFISFILGILLVTLLLVLLALNHYS